MSPFAVFSLITHLFLATLSILSISFHASFNRLTLFLRNFGYLFLRTFLGSHDRAETSAAYLRGLPSIRRMSRHRFLHLYIRRLPSLKSVWIVFAFTLFPARSLSLSLSLSTGKCQHRQSLLLIHSSFSERIFHSSECFVNREVAPPALKIST